VLPTLLLQTGEIQAVESLVTKLTDTGYLGIAVMAMCILLVGGIIAYFQQKNFGKQSESSQKSTETLIGSFTSMMSSLSERLEQAQNYKDFFGSVIDNQQTILASQADQGKLLMALPELIGLVNEALTLLRETVAQTKETALETGQQTAAGFGRVEERFDTVDMQNGKILAELVKLNANIQRWIDGQQQGTAAQMKEQRKLNEKLLETLQLMQESLDRGTSENPVVKSEEKKPGNPEEK